MVNHGLVSNVINRYIIILFGITVNISIIRWINNGNITWLMFNNQQNDEQTTTSER